MSPLPLFGSANSSNLEIMNYYKAKQRESDGRWDFTCTNGGVTWPVGYCRPWQDWPDNVQAASPKASKAHRQLQHKHHGDGHETPEEAAKCYHEYELDHRLYLDVEATRTAECEVCGESTRGRAKLGDLRTLSLCDAHRNREEVARLVPPSSEFWTS